MAAKSLRVFENWTKRTKRTKRIGQFTCCLYEYTYYWPVRSDTLRIRVDVLKIWYRPIFQRIEPYDIFMYLSRMALLLRSYGVAQSASSHLSFHGSKVIN